MSQTWTGAAVFSQSRIKFIEFLFAIQSNSGSAVVVSVRSAQVLSSVWTGENLKRRDLLGVFFVSGR